MENGYSPNFTVPFLKGKSIVQLQNWKDYQDLKKGNSVILEGKFSPSENSKRPSFTCYSFEIINHE